MQPLRRFRSAMKAPPNLAESTAGHSAPRRRAILQTCERVRDDSVRNRPSALILQEALSISRPPHPQATPYPLFQPASSVIRPDVLALGQSPLLSAIASTAVQRPVKSHNRKLLIAISRISSLAGRIEFSGNKPQSAKAIQR